MTKDFCGKCSIELSTGLPFTMLEKLDIKNPIIKIDWNFLRRILQRLNNLKSEAPDCLAKADIPDAIEFANIAYKKIKII